MTMSQDETDDWGAIGTLWQAQPVLLPDLERLRLDAQKATRQVRWLTLLDVALTVLAIVMVARFLEHRPGFGLAEGLVLGMMALAIAFAGWVLYNRRHALRDNALVPDALVTRELRRVQASRRFWRVNTWVVTGLWLAIVGLAAAEALGLVPVTHRFALWVAPVLNLPLTIVSVLWGRRRQRSLWERQKSLHALQRQLES